MQEKLKKEIQVKFTIDSQDAIKALNLINKEYSGIAEKSPKIVSGNNEISRSMMGVKGASQFVCQAVGQVNNSFDKNTQISPVDSVAGVPDHNNSASGSDLESAKKKYKSLNLLATESSRSIQKIDEGDMLHKIKTTDRTLKSIEVLFAKHTTAYKAFVVASTIMDTYQATEAAYKSAAEIPLVGFIIAPAVAAAATIAGMQLVNQISSVQIPAYAKGGAIVGENGPEIIAPFQDYASGQAKLISMTMMTLKSELNSRNYVSPVTADNEELLNEVKILNKNFEKYSQSPVIAKAYLDDREARKIYNRGSAINRKSKI
jgi:hypothetical protein